VTSVDSRAAAPWSATTVPLKEVERAFAGRAEQEVVAALEQAIRSSGLEPGSTDVRERARGISAASEAIEDR
jgi:hypothetical protein